jgi:lipoprotein-anchoring transpeptidase ErfK/SrfK
LGFAELENSTAETVSRTEPSKSNTGSTGKVLKKSYQYHASSSAESSGKAHISLAEYKNEMAEIEKLSAKEKTWLKAKEKYQALLKRNLSTKERRTAEKGWGDLNIIIIFSPILTADSFSYTVVSGDSLFKLAKKYNTTVELIKRSNHLKDEVIQMDAKLKISKAKYSIAVDKSSNTLKLFSDGEPVKTYLVATGKDNSTPIGTFTIENKLENPTWYKAGIIAPSGSADNILGTRWLGFSLAHYGIHGTTLPETIGQQASEGCVRMLNQEVEELYDIVPIKTSVEIKD